uniref:Perlustrin n=1 Tax=Patella vulgata TaxID=6465 RepID=J7QU88_PATVU|nr:Perlustrin [Patella vulgata]
MKTLFLHICVVLVVIVVTGSDALSCAPCLNHRFLPRKRICPKLPKTCEPASKPCGCCPVCAGKVGDRCGRFQVRCEKGLTCQSQSEPTSLLGAYTISFNYLRQGICRKP